MEETYFDSLSQSQQTSVFFLAGKVAHLAEIKPLIEERDGDVMVDFTPVDNILNDLSLLELEGNGSLLQALQAIPDNKEEESNPS